jgi:glycosyltransferase involved in cell wall biosynthesis
MNVVQVNYSDLPGRRFNGYDLHLSLIENGYRANQIVLEKHGDAPTAIPLANANELFVRSVMRRLEDQLSINNLLFPFGKALYEHPIFQNADIAHYHVVHLHFLSILDFPRLMSAVPSLWTLHDPWPFTGHCVHPYECTGWQNGCFNCPQLDDHVFPMKNDKASQMWKIKKQVYRELDVDIVVASRFMEDFVKDSPLTSHFKNVHRIPFGIDIEGFQLSNKENARKRWGILDEEFVIAFRAESNQTKGLKYILDMLDKLALSKPVAIITVGTERLPTRLAEKYRVVELGWQKNPETIYDFYAASDIFLMPSLGESFGLMAIEAMAAGRPVVVFENTVLSEITFAPECGIAVTYKSSDMMKVSVERLMNNPSECYWRGEKGKELAHKHYRYEDYLIRHIELYQEVLNRKKLVNP